MTQSIPHPARPAHGLLRLSQAQVDKLQQLYGLLRAFVAQHGGEGRMEIVVKRGKPRFCRLDLPAWGNLPSAGMGKLNTAQLTEIDAKVSSLCAFTERDSEARLVIGFDAAGRMDARMVLSHEFDVAA